METAIINGLAVLPSGVCKADIWFEGGRISGVGRYPGAGEAYDAEGCLVFPGFIDAHTHFQMEAAGTVTADSFATGTLAALRGGTTTVIDFATQEKGKGLCETLERRLAEAEGECCADYGLHAAVTDWNEKTRRELGDMISFGVTSFKVYMAYENLRLSNGEIFELLCRAAELGALTGAHCERGDMVAAGVAREIAAGNMKPRFHPASRPPTAESLAVREFAELALRAGAPAWVVHLSAGKSLEELRRARGEGARLLAETCPQYLTLTRERYDAPGFEGAKYVCSPPLRSIDDQNALWDGVLSGDIDIISTDHCSFNYKGQKELGLCDFSKIPNGLPGVEHRPALIWTQALRRGIPPERVARLLSEAPARAFGLYPRKGALLPGSDADIVVWDPDCERVLRAAEQTQNVDYSPWEGETLRGAPRAVFLRGERGGQKDAPAGRRGVFLKRGAPELP